MVKKTSGIKVNVKTMITFDDKIVSIESKLLGSSEQLQFTKVYIEQVISSIEEKNPEMKNKRIEIITTFEDGFYLTIGKDPQEVTEFDT